MAFADHLDKSIFFFFNETLQAAFKFAVCLRLVFLDFVFFHVYEKKLKHLQRLF